MPSAADALGGSYAKRQYLTYVDRVDDAEYAATEWFSCDRVSFSKLHCSLQYIDGAGDLSCAAGTVWSSPPHRVHVRLIYFRYGGCPLRVRVRFTQGATLTG